MMTGMDSQFIANFHSGIAAYAALFSLILAIVVWYYSSGSKRAKEKAEAAHQAALQMSDAVVRSAEAAEKLLEQKEQVVTKQPIQLQSEIATNLRRPEFELTHVVRTTFSLRNVTMGPIKVLDVVNSDQFIELDLEKIVKEFQSGEMVQVTLNYYGDDANLRLRIDGRDHILCVPIEYNLELL
mgnify:FL=1|jgi:hypothetical protein